jgi:hypothetical protein
MNFDPHLGQSFTLVVTNKATQAVVGNVNIPSLTNGGIYLGFPGGLTAGETYNVDYWADVDKNGACDAPSTDHVWHKEVVADATGPTLLEVVHDTDWTDVCSSFALKPAGKDLEVSGTMFTPHVNDNFYAVVVEKDSGNTIAWAAINPLTDGTFHWKWAGLLTAGKEYAFNYYADVSNDGACEAAPTDHVWTKAIPAVTDNVALTDITHDTNWTDVCSTF